MNRSIDHHFLDDEYVLSLKHDEFRVFIQAILRTNVIGIQKSSLPTIAFHAQITQDRLLEIITKFSDDNKMHYIQGSLIITNHYKYFDYSTPNVAKGAIKAIIGLEGLPKYNIKISEPISHICDKIIQQMAGKRTEQEINDILRIHNLYNPNALNPNGNLSLPLANPKLTLSEPLANPNATLPIYNKNQNLNQNQNKNLSTPLPPPGESTPEHADHAEGVSGGGFRKAGGGGSRTIDVHLTEEELKKLVDEYGDEAILSIPYEVLDWSEEKGIPISNMYKMCVSFIKARIKKGTWEN